jgi:alpha-tubulin suppressor-like RCC1 family protein
MNNIKFFRIFLIIGFVLLLNITKAQQTVTLNPTEDAWLRMCLNPAYAYITNTSYPNVIFANADEWTHSGYRIADRVVMKFDLTSIPVGSVITSARLSLYAHNPQPDDNYKHRNYTITQNSGYKQNACYLERITQSWTETTVTWANQPATSTANRIVLPESQTVNQDYINLDVTAMVTDMLADPANSYGFMMRLVNEVKYARMAFCSVNHSDPARWPKLVVEYTPPTCALWTRKNDTPDDVYLTMLGNFTIQTNFSSTTKGYNLLGNILMEYDPTTDTWTRKADYPGQSGASSSCFVIGNKVYAGLGSLSISPFWTNDFWEYDITTNVWTQKANFAGAGRAYATGFSIGTKGYICLGASGSYYNDVWEYDPTADNWTQKANFPGQTRVNCKSFTIDNKEYLVGGLDANYSTLNSVWVYTPETDSWEEKNSTPFNIDNTNYYVFAISNKGYIYCNGDSYTKDMWEYTPGTDQWTLITHYPGIESPLFGFSMGNKAYLGRGNYADNKEFWEFNPCGLLKPQISAGYNHSLLLKADGSIWAWGNNSSGQLGNGTTTNETSPIQVGNANNWIEIAAGFMGSHSLAINVDGTLWAWGNNGSGALGDGTNNNSSSPIQIDYPSTWSHIAGGQGFSLGIKTDGTLWAWGENEYGQLGTGNTTDNNAPVRIGTDSDWKIVAAGAYQSLAIKTDGTLWGWGVDWVNNNTVPTQIGTASDWEFISAGFTHNLAIKTNGTLYAWGSNDDGKLGDGTYTTRYFPTQVYTDMDWSTAYAGFAHSLGIKEDGTVWTWGYNGYGELGEPTNIQRNSPGQLQGIANVASGASSYLFSLILRLDNQYCGAGLNNYGQLGDGSTGNKTSFTCMEFPSNIFSPVSQDLTFNSDLIDNGNGQTCLMQNYPNPVKSTTIIPYFLDNNTKHARIELYHLINGTVKEYQISGKGMSSLEINIQDLPSGVYSYTLFVNGKKKDVKKMVVVR